MVIVVGAAYAFTPVSRRVGWCNLRQKTWPCLWCLRRVQSIPTLHGKLEATPPGDHCAKSQQVNTVTFKNIKLKQQSWQENEGPNMSSANSEIAP